MVLRAAPGAPDKVRFRLGLQPYKGDIFQVASEWNVSYTYGYHQQEAAQAMNMKKKAKKTKTKRGKLRLRELEKKIAPSAAAGKKPAIPTPYAPGTHYGLAKRSNIT